MAHCKKKNLLKSTKCAFIHSFPCTCLCCVVHALDRFEFEHRPCVNFEMSRVERNGKINVNTLNESKILTKFAVIKSSATEIFFEIF